MMFTKSEASLAEASYSVSRSLVDLAETAQAAHPLPQLASPPNPATYGMGGLTSIDWSGPVEPLLKQIANGFYLSIKSVRHTAGYPCHCHGLPK